MGIKSKNAPDFEVSSAKVNELTVFLIICQNRFKTGVTFVCHTKVTSAPYSDQLITD